MQATRRNVKHDAIAPRPEVGASITGHVKVLAAMRPLTRTRPHHTLSDGCFRAITVKRADASLTKFAAYLYNVHCGLTKTSYNIVQLVQLVQRAQLIAIYASSKLSRRSLYKE